MKTFAAGYAAHMATLSYTTAVAIKITRPDAVVYGFTGHDIDDTVAGVLYRANPGLNSTNIVTNSDFSVGNLELTALLDGTIFNVAEIQSGTWKNATFIIFRYNYLGLADGVDTLLTGTLGDIGINLNTVVAELRALSQLLQQSVGSSSSRDCRYRLGSTVKYQGGLCHKNISAPPFTMPAAVTTATSNQIFRDSARLEALDYFGAGEVRWLTGLNAGRAGLVSAYAANGTFTLARAMISTVAIGDTFTAIVGCRKRRSEDCKTKFSNVLNHGGEPDREGFNDLMKRITVDV